MAHKANFGLTFACLLMASLGVSGRLAVAQAPALKTAAVLGVAPSGAKLERMILLLDPPADRRQALLTELEDQRNPASPNYHRWLAPSSFADAYSNSQADVDRVSAWLASQGFQVAPLPAGRGWIEFSGSVAQVEQAFHARILTVETASGETRAALASDLVVPESLKPYIHGLVSLDGTLATSAVTPPQPFTVSATDLAAETSLNHPEALTPRLLAQFLHLDSLHTAGNLGAGQSIAIPARSNVRSSDSTAFRAAFSLPASALRVLPAGQDPGRTADEPAAAIAASWAGVAAPSANIVLVPATTTLATDGLDLALAAIVDQAMAHIVTVGYSSCEAGMTEAHQAFYAALYRQAAAEGISILAATGDSGPSACHLPGSDAPVTTGFAVNALASTPWNTAVGVAAFGAAGPQAGLSALAAWSPLNPADPAFAGGGGASVLYASPTWQPATANSSNQRLLPDLVLPTALDTASSPGLAFCLSGTIPTAGCTLVRSGGSGAASAIFAGIAALIAEQNGPQGNLAPSLYALSAHSGTFTDVLQGSAQLRCAAGTPDCDSTQKIGFAAAAGYDLTTGLGTPDAQKLVTEWANPAANGTALATVTNTTTPGQTINPSGSVVLSAKVASGTVSSAPTGTIAFLDESNNATIDTVLLVPGSGGDSTVSVTVTGVLAQGGHPIVAQYSGDTVYAAANSQPLVVEVQPSATVTAVTPASSSPAPGGSLVVTALVTSSNAGTGAQAPSGTMDFRLDGISQGIKPMVAGVPAANSTNSTSSIAMTMPYVAGNHQIVGFYSGDANYTNSTSPAATVALSSSVSTVLLTPSTVTPLAGSNLQLTVTISPPSASATPPTGTVTITLDGAIVATAQVSASSPASTATTTVTAPAIGTHTLVAKYSGDVNYSTANSPAVTITVGKTATTLAVVPATTTPAANSPLLLTAILTPVGTSSATPTGTVTFTLDGATQGTATLTSGTTATFTITAPASGSHTVQASYGGDTNFASAVAPSVSIAVAKSPTTLSVVPGTTSPLAGSSLLVTATLVATNPGASLPTGTVTFTLDGASAGISNLVSGSPSTASATLSSLTPGTHLLAATYSGDSYYAISTAASVSLTVGKGATITTLTPASLTPTAGSSMVVTATVAAPTPGATQPTGTVSVSMDGAVVGTGTVTAGNPSTASVTIPTIAVGSHLLQATYSGDVNYSGSSSSAVAIVASKGATVTTLTATPPALAPGVTETLTATIAPLSIVTGATYTITGTVSFYDGGTTLLGTAIAAGNAATLTGVKLANNVAHSITAIYSGDINWLPSTALALPLAATTLPDTVALTSNYNAANPEQAVVLTATVTPNATPVAGAEQNPTGTVVFYNGATVIGQAALAAVPLTYTSSATLTVQTLPGGADTISAVYLGDLYYDEAASNLLSLNIQGFTITPSPDNPATNLNIVQGSAGSAAFIVTGLGGFNNQVQVVCAVPTQDDMTCTATPQQVVPTATVTFVVQTFASGGPTSTTVSRNQPFWPRAAGGAALAFLAFFLLPMGRRARLFTGRNTRRFMTLFLLLVGLGAAGIGCSTVSGVRATGTPLGVATLKITASAYVDNTVVSQSVYLTVNVLAQGITAP